MTVEEWLALSEQDLPVKLAEVLMTDHRMYARKFRTDKETVWCCHNCAGEWVENQEGKPCPVPVSDPITIDWDTAMEYRQKLYTAVINEIWQQENEHFGMWKWWAIFARPKHYLIAAAMAIEGAK